MIVETRDPVVVLLEQGLALQVALRAVDMSEDPADARMRCGRVVKDTHPESLIEDTIVVAAARIACLKTRPPKKREPGDLAQPIATLCDTWVAWALGRVVHDLAAVEAIAKTEAVPEAVHALAIHFWAKALSALLKGELDESRRLWRRAVELTSSFGLDSQPAIVWSYVATFFPKG